MKRGFVGTCSSGAAGADFDGGAEVAGAEEDDLETALLVLAVTALVEVTASSFGRGTYQYQHKSAGYNETCEAAKGDKNDLVVNNRCNTAGEIQQETANVRAR